VNFQSFRKKKQKEKEKQTILVINTTYHLLSPLTPTNLYIYLIYTVSITRTFIKFNLSHFLFCFLFCWWFIDTWTLFLSYIAAWLQSIPSRESCSYRAWDGYHKAVWSGIGY
jgi:hypothetical protein